MRNFLLSATLHDLRVIGPCLEVWLQFDCDGNTVRWMDYERATILGDRAISISNRLVVLVVDNRGFVPPGRFEGRMTLAITSASSFALSASFVRRTASMLSNDHEKTGCTPSTS